MYALKRHCGILSSAPDISAGEILNFIRLINYMRIVRLPATRDYRSIARVAPPRDIRIYPFYMRPDRASITSIGPHGSSTRSNEDLSGSAESPSISASGGSREGQKKYSIAESNRAFPLLPTCVVGSGCNNHYTNRASCVTAVLTRCSCGSFVYI